VFDTRLNKRTNVDKISDFRYQDDSIYLDNKYFTKLGSGTFSKPKKFKSDMFVQNSKARDAEDRIVYDKKTGKLYYDEDGTGSKAQVQIATITNKVKLTYQDFFVI
jgi:serralysin